MILRSGLKADASAIAPLIFSSAEADHEYMFRSKTRDGIKFLEFACENDAGIWGYSLTTVVEEGGEVVATITSYPESDVIRLMMSGFKAMYRFYGFWEFPGVFCRSVAIGIRFKPFPKNSVYIANLGTNLKFRGQGFASRLYEHLHQKWQKVGKTIAVADVAESNHGSRRILDRLGYQIQAAKNPKKVHVNRMHKTLNP